jgi:hypothetical protein
MIKNLCADQFFAVNKCNSADKCKKTHVERCFYPCIHFYMGNCKYGFNCLFSHSIKRQLVRPEPAKEVCRKLYYENYCPQGNKCKFSHDLRGEPCIYNSIGNCKFSAESCRYSHEKKVDANIPCFFNLMGGCKNAENCENKHSNENIIKYISYEGPI